MGQQCHKSVQYVVEQIIEEIPKQVEIQVQLLRNKNAELLKASQKVKLDNNNFEQQYWGYLKNNSKQGYGQLKISSYQRYYGYFKNNKPHIKGAIIFSKDHYYIGQFENGQLNGQGREVSLFFTFEGEYKAGQKKYGLLKTQTFTYEGSFSENKFSCYGQLTYQNGQKYMGNFEDGNFNGEGLYYEKNRLIYEGVFSNNFYHGFGKYFWEDGSYYEGEYQFGQKHGNGKYVQQDEIISGKWQKGELVQKEKNLDDTANSEVKNK